MDQLLASLGPEVEDAEEEAFLLFSQQIPSQNLGFLDPKAPTLDLTVTGKDITIRQSPGLLDSSRKQGTTGAVLWKITPLFAEWIASPGNLLGRCGVIHQSANVLELGCGISGLISLVLASQVRKYVNTDQEYVLKYVRDNVGDNYELFSASSRHTKIGRKRHVKAAAAPISNDAIGNILIRSLDWETSDLAGLYKDINVEHLDLIVSCDCIYNENLVEPLATTMRSICQLAPNDKKPTIVVVAQQLRSPDVLEAWLKTFCGYFRVWRVPDEALHEGLCEGSGYVTHLGVLRGSI